LVDKEKSLTTLESIDDKELIVDKVVLINKDPYDISHNRLNHQVAVVALA
jgi:hypothetical protein